MLSDSDKARLRELIPAVTELLNKVAAGECDLAVAQREYNSYHVEARDILGRVQMACLCPWESIYEFNGRAAQDSAWEAKFIKLVQPARFLCELDTPPPWELVDYHRNGDPNDVPFVTEFMDALEGHKQDILVEHLEEELQFRGIDVMKDWQKGHLMPCGRKRGRTSDVCMYKIRRGHPTGDVILRVFFMTAPGFKLILLHGYDKGADVDPTREDREAEEACRRRADVLNQRS